MIGKSAECAAFSSRGRKAVDLEEQNDIEARRAVIFNTVIFRS